MFRRVTTGRIAVNVLSVKSCLWGAPPRAPPHDQDETDTVAEARERWLPNGFRQSSLQKGFGQKGKAHGKPGGESGKGERHIGALKLHFSLVTNDFVNNKGARHRMAGRQFLILLVQMRRAFGHIVAVRLLVDYPRIRSFRHPLNLTIS
jgi:hypothetical protein